MGCMMKKLMLCMLIVFSALTLFAQKRNDCEKFKTIYTSKIQNNQSSQPKYQMSEYYIYRKDGNEYYARGFSEKIVQSYLTWKLGDNEVSVFPRSEYKEIDPVYNFDQIFFLTKSRLWVITYEYDYPEDYTGEELKSGLLFFSEDGKSLIKEIKLNSFDSQSCVFDSDPQDFSNDIVYNRYTDANVFLCFPYVLSVYGDIIYTISNNNPRRRLSFSKNGQFLMFYDEVNKNYNIYSVTYPGLVYQDSNIFIDNFNASSDKQFCGYVSQTDGEIVIHKLNPITHKVIKTYRSFVYYIDGAIYNKQIVLDENTGYTTAFYDIKIRFQEGTNNLIIISDDQYESVVEIDFKE